MKKWVTVGIIFISIVLLLIIIFIKQVPKTIELTTFEKAYNIVQLSDEEVIEIPVYINYLDSYLVKEENISSININNSDDSLSFSVIKIVDTKEVTYFKNKKFYKYVFILNPIIKLEDNFSLEMNNSVLEINYIQGITTKINIGSFCYYYYNSGESSLALKQLKGLINTYEDKTLVGVLIGLKSNTKDKINIKNITPLDINVGTDLGNIVTNIDFNQGQPIEEILGYKYDPFKYEINSEFNIIIENEVKLFIPLKYKKNILLNKIGFLIEYEINNEVKYLCIDDFLFFDTGLYSRNKINNLKFYTYENY